MSFSYLRYVVNELQGNNTFGSRQTPALNKQLAESFADQAAFNSFTNAPDLGLNLSRPETADIDFSSAFL